MTWTLQMYYTMLWQVPNRAVSGCALLKRQTTDQSVCLPLTNNTVTCILSAIQKGDDSQGLTVKGGTLFSTQNGSTGMQPILLPLLAAASCIT